MISQIGRGIIIGTIAGFCAGAYLMAKYEEISKKEYEEFKKWQRKRK